MCLCLNPAVKTPISIRRLFLELGRQLEACDASQPVPDDSRELKNVVSTLIKIKREEEDLQLMNFGGTLGWSQEAISMCQERGIKGMDSFKIRDKSMRAEEVLKAWKGGFALDSLRAQDKQARFSASSTSDGAVDGHGGGTVEAGKKETAGPGSLDDDDEELPDEESHCANLLSSAGLFDESQISMGGVSDVLQEIKRRVWIPLVRNLFIVIARIFFAFFFLFCGCVKLITTNGLEFQKVLLVGHH